MAAIHQNSEGMQIDLSRPVHARSTILAPASAGEPRQQVARMLLFRGQMPRKDRMSARNTSRLRASLGFAAWAVCLFVGWAGACGKTSRSAGKLVDGSAGGAGGVNTAAGTGTGGVLGTGGMGTDAGTGTGGAIGTGGMASDAGSGIACTDDGGVGLAAAARQCTQDSDCTILTGAAIAA
jgi:hypothetical protein